MTSRELFERLYRTKERFFIAVTRTDIQKNFIKDCKDPRGFKAVNRNTYSIEIKFFNGSNCTCPHNQWHIFLNDFDTYGKIVLADDPPFPTSNKGLKECFFCSCPTEMKRDFKTFEVREFCPRCKI